MIRFLIPTNRNLRADLTTRILNDVCQRIYHTDSFEIVEVNRSTGRYITTENDETGEKHVVCFSNPNNNSRNAHLMQFISPAYIEYENLNAEHKALDIYLIDPSQNDKTEYIKMFYRCFLTLGITILNIDQLFIAGLSRFESYTDLSDYRKRTSERNSRNRSTYFTDDDTHISIYGKTFGANAMESFIFALTINKLVKNKPIYFYPVVDNESTNLSEDQRNLLIAEGLQYENSILLKNNGYAVAPRDTSRDTPAFHYNLLQKYGDKRCYLCGCDIEHLIIGSHIERVTDINKNSSYSNEEKSIHATDGDNGFWLCANHDKMFEYGIIYFDHDHLKVNNCITAEEQKKYIDKSIYEMVESYPDYEIQNPFVIKPEHYNQNMDHYIALHKSRILWEQV